MSWVQGTFLDEGMLAGAAAALDAGASTARVLIYDVALPANGGDPGAAPLVTLVLAKPAAELINGSLKLHQFDAEGDLILLEGVARSGRLLSASGAWCGDGDVSGPGGDGVFKISGADPARPTQLHAGGRAILSDSWMAW